MAKLTTRQLQAIPLIISNATFTKGAEAAGISRKTLYKWLEQPEFKKELESQRKQLTSEAFGILEWGLTKAVAVLVGLLNSKDDRLKRLAAKDVIDFIIRHKENEDLDERLKEVEKLLAEKKL